MTTKYLGNTGTAADADLELLLGAIPVGYMSATTSGLRRYLQNTTTVNVKNHGAIGDGVADDSPAIIAAIVFAELVGRNVVFFPSGTYRITQTIYIHGHVTLCGEGFPAGGVNELANPGSTIIHDFDGPGFWFDGTGGGTQTSGGGMMSLRIVQKFGDPAHAVGYGAAIKIAAGSSALVSWKFFYNLIIEEKLGVLGPWTWAFELDGTVGGGWTDVFIERVDTHVNSSSGKCGAFHINDGTSTGTGITGEVALFDVNCSFNGDFYIGDTGPVSTTILSNVQARDLKMDNCVALMLEGGNWNSFVGTANTSGSAKPSQLVVPYVDHTGGKLAVFVYQQSLGHWQSNVGHLIDNSSWFSGMSAALAVIQMMGIDVNNLLRLLPFSGHPVAIGVVTNPAGLGNGWLMIEGMLRMGPDIDDPIVYHGSGVPNFSAPLGSLFLRKNGGAGSSLYVMELGGTTWTAK